METPAGPCTGPREGNPILGLQLGSCVSNTPSVPQKQDDFKRRDHLLELLKAVTPEVFRIPPVPLAVGIRRQVLDLAGDEVPWNDIAAVLRRWASRYDYIAAIAAGGQRFNLDGSHAGEVTPEHQQFARAQLAACTAPKPIVTEK
jgi:sRNA-binding protein